MSLSLKHGTQNPVAGSGIVGLSRKERYMQEQERKSHCLLCQCPNARGGGGVGSEILRKKCDWISLPNNIKHGLFPKYNQTFLIKPKAIFEKSLVGHEIEFKLSDKNEYF